MANETSLFGPLFPSVGDMKIMFVSVYRLDKHRDGLSILSTSLHGPPISVTRALAVSNARADVSLAPSKQDLKQGTKQTIVGDFLKRSMYRTLLGLGGHSSFDHDSQLGQERKMYLV